MWMAGGWDWRWCRPRGMHSLRAKLTLVNVALLALGIVAATAVSLMGMRHYLTASVDSSLTSSRDSLQRSGLSMREIESLSSLAFVRDHMAPDLSGADALPGPETLFVTVDDDGEPVSLGGFEPTPRQRELASAVGDAEAFSDDAEPRDIALGGDAFRAVGARLSDGTAVLIAMETSAVHESVTKALKLDLVFGTVLLALLAVLTMIGAHHRLRPLEDMVETASAIAEGDLTRRVPSSRDPVTEIEQLRVALNSMLHQVQSAFDTRERSAAQLRRFVADASHELRTPLAAIRGYLQLYDQGMLNDPEDRARAGIRMRGEVDRMGRLVDELLTLARLDQQPELRFRNVDLSRLVRDAAADLRAQQPDRPLSVAAVGALLVHADESGLRQVLGNLLGNVRTHTPPDAAARVELAREDGMVRLRVADEGPGLAEEDAARIFDRFFRTGGAPGSGLGMAIVQGVVTAHGGSVDVRTSPGAGLAVTVTLPACKEAADSLAASPAEWPADTGRLRLGEKPDGTGTRRSAQTGGTRTRPSAQPDGPGTRLPPA